MTYFFVGLPIRLIYRIRRKVDLKVKKGEVYIFAANHPSRVDPFLACYALPFKDFVKLIPFRLITADKYLKIPIVGQLLLLYGCISTKKVNGKSVLDKSKELMKKGETIFIFPNGKLERGDILEPPKVGFVYLEREINNSCIIPVKIDIKKSGMLPCTYIHYKQQVRHKTFPKDLQPLANDIMNKIRG